MRIACYSTIPIGTALSVAISPSVCPYICLSIRPLRLSPKRKAVETSNWWKHGAEQDRQILVDLSPRNCVVRCPRPSDERQVSMTSSQPLEYTRFRHCATVSAIVCINITTERVASLGFACQNERAVIRQFFVRFAWPVVDNGCTTGST